MKKKPKDRGEKVPSKYRLFIIVKQEKEDKKLTYHSDNLLSFTDFLNKTWPAWDFFVVYNNRSAEKEELARFTKENPPIRRNI